MNRTAPTISPLNLNNAAPASLFKMGKMQLLVLAGVICGSMVAAYYLGLVTGRRTGYDTAMMARMNEMVRVPTDPNDVDAIDLENREPIFAKLTKTDDDDFADLDRSSMEQIGTRIQESSPLPELQPIREFEAAAPADLIPEDSTPNITIKENPKEILLTGKVVDQGGSAARVVKLEDSEQDIESIGQPVLTTKDYRKILPTKEVKKEPKTTITTPYVVQVAAPRLSKEAEDVVAKLKKSGYKNVSIERADVKGQSYYRVLVAGGKTKDEADKVASTLKKAKIVRGEPFVRHVG